MPFVNLTQLAQLNPADIEITAGQAISVILVLMTMGLSLIINVKWFFRWQRDGHMIPAARRGLLRVPPGVMVAGLVLAFLIVAMVTANALVPADAIPVDAMPVDAIPVVADPVPVNAEVGKKNPEPPVPESPDSEESAPADAPDTEKKLPADGVEAADNELPLSQIHDALLQTIVFDIAMLIIFGVLVYAATQHGRVFPDEQSEGNRSDAGHRFDEFPGESFRQPYSTDPDFSDSNSWAARDALALHASRNPDDADVLESWRFLTEFRWAVEVFLAAYLPTTILKLLVMISLKLITGDEPASHPFLEMMGQDVEWGILAMIVILAAFMAPVVEELFYRVVILGGLTQSGQLKAGLIVSSVVFCFAHGFPDSLALLPLAFILGYTYLRRRSYRTVMMVHFLFNAFNLLVAGLALIR